MTSRPKTIFRPLDGILLLDKPQGLSSNRALQQVRHLLRAEKGGHTGSLDPLATGLLPLCFGEATKIAGLLLGSAKAYEVTAMLGLTTDTDDADGSVLLQRPVPAIDAASLQAALAPLTGRIQQRAPIYSALKQGGEPLYAKARRGEAIEAPVREVEVQRIEILAQAPQQVSLRVTCGSGTYIRSLVRDLGETLGCGAHVSHLRRLWVEPFMQPRMVTLEALQALAMQDPAHLEDWLLPVEAGLSGFPRVEVSADEQRRLGLGQSVQRPAGDLAGEHTVALFTGQGRCMGLGRLDGNGSLQPQRLFRWAAS
ncbi:tRNA pseudouridine(55) synthase TruB [Pseudoxanthomonas dokdonensis]|uniref:tRNA pseudouridine synthase B n=1 Tax=Pseudoxanthomonas dokdonensis TaxID=344882 RepID=A0A0R0CH91_9GAMM|nr:tRNA pseudouridine(55) synthase TruB [Pseudoxanthomonas dokdonensis]KRG69197.1 tRNA pseudouridine synthase B [Pseudoxanthomonas dokdonensis]